jgi:hypothetical protein
VNVIRLAIGGPAAGQWLSTERRSAVAYVASRTGSFEQDTYLLKRYHHTSWEVSLEFWVWQRYPWEDGVPEVPLGDMPAWAWQQGPHWPITMRPIT